MTSRIASDSSPFRSTLLHGALGFMVLAGTFGTAAAAIHFAGDVDAASPSLRVALFENEDGVTPGLNPRLPAEGGNALTIYANGDSAVTDAGKSEPDLGVEYADAYRAVASASDAGSTRQAVAQGIRINGQTVLPGQSLSQVNAAVISTAKSAAPTQTPDAAAPPTVFERYARPFSNPEAKPTVSIILGGLGINRGRTQAAIDELPPEVTLSFAPTTVGLQTWVSKARRAGHEVLIEVPMEPYDYGRERPHAQVMQVSAGGEINTKRLGQLLSRVSGYTGVMNYQGGKFATDAEAAAPVFEYLTDKGVAFFEDGSLTRSVFEASAASKGTIFGKAGAWIDARPGADEISSELMRLEADAMDHGASLGVGMSYPITVDLLKEWTERLEAKGLLLAPASYYAKQAQSSGQVRIAALDPQG